MLQQEHQHTSLPFKHCQPEEETCTKSSIDLEERQQEPTNTVADAATVVRARTLVVVMLVMGAGGPPPPTANTNNLHSHTNDNNTEGTTRVEKKDDSSCHSSSCCCSLQVDSCCSGTESNDNHNSSCLFQHQEDCQPACLDPCVPPGCSSLTMVNEGGGDTPNDTSAIELDDPNEQPLNISSRHQQQPQKE